MDKQTDGTNFIPLTREGTKRHAQLNNFKSLLLVTSPIKEYITDYRHDSVFGKRVLTYWEDIGACTGGSNIPISRFQNVDLSKNV